MAIIGLLWGGEIAKAQDYNPQDFLPLAVGNSWTYYHTYYDLRPELEDISLDRDVFTTITITHTEEIDGHIYYAFSEMEYEWPPAPYFFLAGKKVRWAEDHRLMERWQDGEVSLYNFNPTQLDVPYAIPEQDRDTLGKGHLSRFSILLSHFGFGGHEDKAEGRGASFLQFFGMALCGISILPTDHPTFTNALEARYAILDGQLISYEDATRPHLTAIEPSTWGQFKRMFLDPIIGDPP